MTPFALSGLLIAVTCFSLAGWVYWRAPRNLANRLLAMFNLFVAIWGVGTCWAGMARSPSEAVWAWRLAHIGGFPLGVTFFHLVLVLSESPSRRIVGATYAFGAVAVMLCTTGVIMRDAAWVFDSLYYFQANLPYLSVFITWFSIVGIGHKRLFQAAQRARGGRRTQLWIVFFAFATGFAGGTSALLPIIYVNLYPYGNFSIPLYTAILTYAIVRYGFTDIRVVITRAGLLLGIYLLVLGVPFLVGWWGRPWFEAAIGDSWWVIPLSFSTLLGTVGPFAYAFLRRQAEERLLWEQRRYQRTLQRAARGMTQVRNLAKLSRLITRIVSRSVRVTHASLFLWDPTQQRYVLRSSHGARKLALESRYGLQTSSELVRRLSAQHRPLHTPDLGADIEPGLAADLGNLGAVLVVPGLVERQLIGFLVLGPKLSGAPYGPDDLHAFSTLAHEAAVSLENAASYEELLRVNEQLKAAYDRLVFQERLAAAGQFAMGLAHEVKNPLSAIKTFAEYLPEKYDDPAFREKFFRIVQSEIDRINTIIRELSDFAKPAPLQLERIHLTEVIEDTLSLLSNQCLKQGIEVHKSLATNGLCVRADLNQLKQVLLNILMNSLEAMDRGGRLEVSTDVDQNTIKLKVRDNGSGIPAELQPHVWDPFFTTKERGMGLGLAIVRGIVERHGGRITLQSAQGQGTIVDIFLPVAIGYQLHP